MRVVSLVPSATEILCAIGGRGMLVGRSNECDDPAGLDDVPVVSSPVIAQGGPGSIDEDVRSALASGAALYTLDDLALRRLRPDLILTQDLCRVCSIDARTVRQVAASLSPPARVLSLDPHSIEDVLEDVLRVGDAAGLVGAAEHLASTLRERMFRAMDHVTPYVRRPSVAVLEWSEPLYAAGHWTPQLVERAGGEHPLNPTAPAPGSGSAAGPQQVYRRAGPSALITPEQLVASRPEYLVICPCGRTLGQARGDAQRLREQAWWHDLPAVRSGRVTIVDGTQMFARPGPRLIDALEWLVAWLHDRPALIPAGFPCEPFPAVPNRQTPGAVGGLVG